MANLQPNEVVTGPVRISYAHVFEPWDSNNDGNAKYSATLLVRKEDSATMNAIAAAYAEAVRQGAQPKGKWAGQKPPKIDTMIWDGIGIPVTPIYDGDRFRPKGDPFGEEAKGCYVFTATDKSRKPDLVDANGQPILSAYDAAGNPTIYSGCWGRVYLAFFPYRKKGKDGIGCGLRAIQKIRDDEPLTAQRVSSEVAFGTAPQAAPPQGYQPQAAPPQGYQTPDGRQINPITGEVM